jgi:diguanylate cyclase (GGDEF)-like protein
MMFPPIIENEDARLTALHSLALLDTPAESAFDEIVELAAWACHAPIAAITMIDEDRQWLKASVGFEVREIGRDISFCGHAIVDGMTMVVPDLRLDPRFVDNPLVTDDPSIRFYAGVPVYVDGHAVGTLCVLDTRPRSLFCDERRALEILARQAAARLVAQRLEWRSFDQLTGVSTELSVDRWMITQDAETRRAALHFGIDDLQGISKEHGRDAADDALIATARALRANAPDEALVARVGDEFVVLMQNVNNEALHEQIDQYRTALEEAAPGHVDVSIGLATAAAFASGHDLIAAAERATQLEKQLRRI